MSLLSVRRPAGAPLSQRVLWITAVAVAVAWTATLVVAVLAGP
ncbi:hypothetical protein [Marmoricola sp. RAF53]